MAIDFLVCKRCGREFRSAFSPSTAMVGCSEPCPDCAHQLDSPTVIGGLNFDEIKRELAEPIQRTYPDGEVFMGKGGLGLDLPNPVVARFFPAYSRDFRRSLEMLDGFYELDRSKARQFLSYIYTQTWAAYEALVLAILNALLDANLVALPRSKPGFGGKQDLVFAALGFATGFPPVLKMLYVQRNSLAHRSGIVDKELLDALGSIAGAAPLVARLALGAPLPVDASSAVAFLDTVQHAARALLVGAQAKL